MGKDSLIERLNFVLLSCYVLIALLSLFQLCRMRLNRHSLKSFQAGFLFLCFSWTTMRSFFWLVSKGWPDSVILFLFWLPINVQFATFSLLVLYYARVVNRRNWDSHKKRFFMIYAITNIVLFLLLVAGIILETTSSYGYSLSNEVHTVFSASLAFILIVVLAGYTIQLMRLTKEDRSGKMVFQLSPSPLQVVCSTFTIIVIFASRCVIDIISSMDPDTQSSFVVMKTHSRIVNTTSFTLYLLWEIIPTVVVIMLFRHIPKSPKHQVSFPGFLDSSYDYHGGASVQSGGVGSQADLRQPMLKQSPAINTPGLFENDLRYDSDDEAARTNDPYNGVMARPSPTISVMSGTPVAGSLGPPPYMYSIAYAGSSPATGGQQESPWAAFTRTPTSARHQGSSYSNKAGLPPVPPSGQTSLHHPHSSAEAGSPLDDLANPRQAAHQSNPPPPLIQPPAHVRGRRGTAGSTGPGAPPSGLRRTGSSGNVAGGGGKPPRRSNSLTGRQQRRRRDSETSNPSTRRDSDSGPPPLA